MKNQQKNAKIEKITKESLFFTAENAEKIRQKIHDQNKSQNNWLINFFK